MAGIVFFVTLMLAMGFYFFFLVKAIKNKKKESLKRVVILGGVILVLSLVFTAVLSTNVFAQENHSTSTTTAPNQDPLALGLKYVGAALAVGLAAIGAGIAVGPIGVSAISVIAEKPEMFGTSLIFIGLAEGIAIYGIAIAILVLFVL
ncbi:MAG: ATP synthase subunit C [Brevinematia bacterium]